MSYKIVLFRTSDALFFRGHETPSQTVQRAARENLGLDHADLNPSYNAATLGRLNTGDYVHAVEVKADAADRLRLSPGGAVVAVADTQEAFAELQKNLMKLKHPPKPGRAPQPGADDMKGSPDIKTTGPTLLQPKKGNPFKPS